MTIVVVDADPDRAVLLQHLLGPLGDLAVRSVDSADALFRGLAAGSLPPPAQVEVLVLALRLPGEDAATACRRLRADAAWDDVPLLVLAADTESEELQRCFDAGATDFLPLPFGLAEARLRLRAVLQLRAALRQRRAQEAEVAAARDALQRSLDTVRADLGAASRLQRSLLPPPAPALAGTQAGWCFRPCDEIGGDGFGLLPLPDGRLAVYMLDVAGHGVPAALLSVTLHRLLSARLEGGVLLDDEGGVRAPHEVVARLSRLFEPQRGSTSYFTLSYAVLDARAGLLELCQAGHPPLLLAEPGRPVTALTEGDMPVGLLPGARYHSVQQALAPASRIVLYTDAALETEGGSGGRGGEAFGLERWQAAVEASRGLAPQAAAEQLEDAVRAWAAPAALGDDLTVLVIDCL